MFLSENGYSARYIDETIFLENDETHTKIETPRSNVFLSREQAIDILNKAGLSIGDFEHMAPIYLRDLENHYGKGSKSFDELIDSSLKTPNPNKKKN